MIPEIAARTGPLAAEVNEAERLAARHDAGALPAYTTMAERKEADARTLRWVHYLALTASETHERSVVRYRGLEVRKLK